jgi:7,8-dihydropterin-6-yl-methyl-4-(beta-D-ribofuranosyl)aminobenzene 5'-phosphate synthase
VLTDQARPDRDEKAARQRIPLAPAETLRITILMDNLTDPLLFPQGGVERHTWFSALAPQAPRLPSLVSPAEGLPDPLLAQPGFSALIRVGIGGRERTILFDTGVTPTGMTENMRRLAIDPREIEAIVLSHGHWDHVAGMEGLVRELGRAALPVLIHPEFWRRRRIALPGLEPAELPSTSRPALEGAGFEIVEEREPSFLLDGCVLVTGEVDRTTPFETGFRGHEAQIQGRWQPDPLILDDQALIVRLKERGLVVLTGCGHAGIVNVVRHAIRLTGEPRVAAVIGGFHLSGPMFEPMIEPTVAAFDELRPSVLMPAHCTGWRAVHRLAARYPEAFVQCAVGTTLTL